MTTLSPSISFRVSIGGNIIVELFDLRQRTSRADPAEAHG
jgi:hypothetical protein